jgi:hypothetical protein
MGPIGNQPIVPKQTRTPDGFGPLQHQLTDQLMQELDESKFLHYPLMNRIEERIRTSCSSRGRASRRRPEAPPAGYEHEVRKNLHRRTG